jgi:hypothetical protein
MGVLSDFVLASEDELGSALVSWRKVAPQPQRVRQRRVNPFTKQAIEVEALEWMPDPSEIDPFATIDLTSIELPDAVRKVLARVPDPDGKILAANKLALLDERGLSQLPRVQYKSITTLELISLAEIMFGDDALSEELERPALLPPDVASNERWVHKIPEPLVAAIAGMDDGRLEATVAAWAEELEYAPADVREVLSGLQGLCMRAVRSGKSVFLHGGL